MDAKLQELKRLAKQGDNENKASYIAALVKSGKLRRFYVQLAARLGAPEALLLEQAPIRANEKFTHIRQVLQRLSLAELHKFIRQLAIHYGIDKLSLEDCFVASLAFEPSWAMQRLCAYSKLSRDDFEDIFRVPEPAYSSATPHFLNLSNALEMYENPRLLCNFLLYGNVAGL